MKWANFLHFYQPPTQTPDILKKVVDESYRKVAEEIKSTKKGRMTINISGALTELWLLHGYDDVIALYRDLLEQGKIELVESMMYHPFSPKLPEDEIRRQIRLNHEINRKAFGPSYAPRGFFVPEMVYTEKVGKIIADLGYEWIILDESSFPSEKYGPVRYDRLYRLSNLKGMYGFFRNRRSSFKILSAQVGTGEAFINDLVTGQDEKNFIVTAMDGETFGHHRYGLEKLLSEVMSSPKVEAVSLSDLLTVTSQVEDIVPVDGTWALFSMDEVRLNPFSRWYDPKNKIHRYQWQLTALAIKTVHEHPSPKARKLLDQSVHSDQYWWASAKPWWNIDMLGAGAQELLDTVRASRGVSKSTIKKAEDLFIAILSTAFMWRKTGIVDKLVKEHIDEEARYRIQENLRGMPADELKNLVKHLQNQMQEAIDAKEYNRASEFQKRIKELDEQRNFFLKKVLDESSDGKEDKMGFNH